MITFSKEPISAVAVGQIHAWLSRPEAQMFRECLEAEMTGHYLEAVNTRGKPVASDLDYNKQELIAMTAELNGRAIRSFLEQFDNLSKPKEGFYRIKIYH